MNIVVLGGGDSPERAVSLRSAAAVTKSLEDTGYTVTKIDPKYGLSKLDGLSDVVFPILHGEGGEDGVLQRELEQRKLPYLGSTSKVSSVCFDKSLTRKAMQAAGLPVARGDTVTRQSYMEHELKSVPHVLKVSRGGSSIGTYILRDPSITNDEKVDEVFNLCDEAVVEEFIEGIEITVPVLDVSALPVIEIIPPQDGEFDYENKYNGKTKEICPSTSLSLVQQKEAKALATKVHRTVGARHLSRTDIIVKSNGDMVILEINTMPGMTDQSLFPLAAQSEGISMPELMTKFVDLVKRDYGIKE